MLYIVIISVWSIAFAHDPLFTLVMTGLICLAIFPSRRGNKIERTRGEYPLTKSADCMTVEELKKYTIIREASDRMGDWDGTPAKGMKEHYEEELNRRWKEDVNDPENQRMKEILSAHILENQAKEDAAMAERDDRRERLKQIVKKARLNVEFARKNVDREQN